MAVLNYLVKRSTLLVMLVTIVGVLTPTLPSVAPAPADASTRPFTVPIPAGDTWYVCQGYNGEMTHRGVPALDLSLARESAGPNGCLMATKYTSAGSEVISPAAGTAYRTSGCCGDDFVCVDLDSGGSVAVGHLHNRVRDGSRVGTADRLGIVAWPGPENGHYAHIHIQAHPVPGCMKNSKAVPFDSANGFRFACTQNLTYSGEPNQYSGLALTRCGDGASNPKATRDGEARQDDSLGPKTEWAGLMTKLLRWFLRFFGESG